MKTFKVLLIFGVLYCHCNADSLSLSLPQVPVLGSVLNGVANVSAGVIGTAIETAQIAGNNVLALRDKFLKLLETFRSNMMHEIVELGLPRLEPFEIPFAKVHLEHEIARINGTIDSVKIVNLSKFKVNGINIKLPFTVHLDLLYDSIDISGNYDIHGVFGDMINLYGNGPFSATIYDISTGVSIVLGFHENRFTVDQMHVTFKFSNMTCNFKNLMGGGENEELFNKVIGEVAPEAVDYLWPEIEPALSERIRQMASDRISKIDYKKILDLFNPFK